MLHFPHFSILGMSSGFSQVTDSPPTRKAPCSGGACPAKSGSAPLRGRLAGTCQHPIGLTVMGAIVLLCVFKMSLANNSHHLYRKL